MKKIIISLIAVLFITGCGKVAMPQNNFEKGLQEYIDSEYNDSSLKTKIKDKIIVVTKDDEEYEVAFNLRGNPTFTSKVIVEKGISYDEYTKKIESLSLPMLGYMAIAYNYGVSPQDASTYFTFTYVSEMFDEADEEDAYVVVDDDIEVTGRKRVIRTSKFPERVLEYVRTTYEDDIDFDDELETYEYSIEASCNIRKCEIISRLEVNPRANFQRLVGYAEAREREGMYKDITPETAKYNIELKVGQKIKISGKKLTGYEMTGMNVVDVSGEYIFEATRPGVSNGYFYINEDDTRSFYITVTPNEQDEVLKTKKLTVK